MAEIQQFHELISKANKILVTAHRRPDLDALCSALGMKGYLNFKYPEKQVDVCLSSDGSPSDWSFVPLADSVIWVEELVDIAGDYDTVVLLDSGKLSRFTDKEKEFEQLNLTTLCIDHHPEELQGFTFFYGDTKAAAAAQLVYELFCREVKEALGKDTLKILLLGILGDTGTLRYINAGKARVLTAVQELVEATGADIQELSEDLSKITENEFEIIRTFVSNMRNVSIPGVVPFSYSFLPRELMSKYTEAEEKNARLQFMYMFFRQVAGYEWGFTVIPDKKGEKFGLSFRSRPGGVDVNHLAAMFGGGGHLFASGADYFPSADEKDIDSEEVIQKVIEVIKTAELKVVPSSK